MNEAELDPALPRSSAQRLLQPIIERIRSISCFVALRTETAAHGMSGSFSMGPKHPQVLERWLICIHATSDSPVEHDDWL